MPRGAFSCRRFALLPLLALLMWWIVGRVLAPVTRLATTIARRRVNALDPIATQALPAELALMVRALNALIARLKDVLGRQQAFMADAAHELRTPLTAISLQAQLLERAEGGADAEEALAELKQGIARSTQLVERLLTLARLDAVNERETPTDVDFSAVVDGAVGNLRALARARGLHLDARIEPAVVVTGYAAQLLTLVDTLVDNALRYTPEGGQVRVELAPAPPRHRLQRPRHRAGHSASRACARVRPLLSRARHHRAGQRARPRDRAACGRTARREHRDYGCRWRRHPRHRSFSRRTESACHPRGRPETRRLGP
jgi:signal transduction histidine kinase